MEKQYINGLYYNLPRNGAPEFVIGSISIHKDKLIEQLKTLQPNDKGYINVDVLQGKEKPYCVLNTYKQKNQNNSFDDITF